MFRAVFISAEKPLSPSIAANMSYAWAGNTAEAYRLELGNRIDALVACYEYYQLYPKMLLEQAGIYEEADAIAGAIAQEGLDAVNNTIDFDAIDFDDDIWASVD